MNKQEQKALAMGAGSCYNVFALNDVLNTTQTAAGAGVRLDTTRQHTKKGGAHGSPQTEMRHVTGRRWIAAHNAFPEAYYTPWKRGKSTKTARHTAAL